MTLPARSLAFVVLASIVTACGSPPVATPDAGEPLPPVPAVTSLSPDPGPFNDEVTVTLTTDVAATIFVTTDGSDPQVESAERITGPSPITLTLDRTTTLTFFSRTAEGAEEAVRTAQYLRAGGRVGTISGVIVVDTLAVNHAVALFANNQPQDLGAVTQAQELPFVIEGLETGTHRLRAMADLNDDGTFLPVVDLASDATTIELDLADPFKASAENVRIYLGASLPSLCTIQGTIKLPEPAAGETIRVSALSPSALSGGGTDPQALLSQFQSGYLIVVDPNQTEYAYAITDLEPGSYMPTPVLFSAGQGFGMNLIADPLRQTGCEAGKVTTANFEFGPVDLSGAVTLQPATAPTQSFIYGMVAARSVALTGGIQAVLMPVIFAPGANAGEYTGGYAGRALKSNRSFGVRAFSSIEAQNPLLDALVWTVTIFGSAQPHASFQTQTSDVQQDLTVPLP